jgi:hypothetical protein
MKKYSLLFFFLFCFLFGAKAQISNTIENTKTPDHLEIPGTKYLLIKPDSSFAIATDFTGLKSKDLKAGLNITELPIPFAEVLPMFTKDLPPKNGKLVLERDLTMNGYKAKLYKTEVLYKSTIDKLTNPAKDAEPMVHWLLIYGNEAMCLTISATYPNSIDKQLSNKIEKSLLSFIYTAEKEVDPLSGLSFSIDLGGTPLKFATVMMQTGAVFNADGKFPSESTDKTGYMILVMPFELESGEQEEKAIRAVKKPTDKNMEIKEVNSIVLGGLKGYEVIGHQKRENTEFLLQYSVTLFDVGRHFVITGLSSDTDKLELFRRVSSTFKLRE